MIDKIKCPNCAHQFDAEQAIAVKLEAQFKAEFEQKVAQQAEIFNKERATLDADRKAFSEAKAKENKLFMKRLEKEKATQKLSIEKELQEQFGQKLKALEEDNEKKKAENQELRQKEIDLLKMKNQLDEQKEQMELEVEKQLLEKQKAIEEKGRAKEREAFALKEKEWQKKFEDQKKSLDEAHRKAEQGSMQMQGEIQELALEEMLSTTYPFDNIKEVPKGIRGADCIQEVVNNLRQICGSIVYESKRTQNWGGDWIKKLKQDQVNCKADIAVIVTQTYPSDMDRFGNKDGVWICGFHEVKSLSMALREILIKTAAARSSEENKGDKMEMLYNYFTSNEFIHNISQVMENYSTMLDQLNQEKRAMARIWAAREKQIRLVETNLASFIGSVEGITGNELDTEKILQLPNQDDF